MKILMASHYFASHKGGIEIVAEELFRVLADSEREVTWLAADATLPPDPLGTSRTISLRVCNFVEDKTGLPFPIPRPSALRKIIHEVSNADVVILHDCLYLSNIFAFVVARLRRVPILVIQHLGFVPYSSRLLNAGMRFANATVTRPMLSHADQVVFISEITRSYFGRLRFKRSPEVVFNGVGTDVYRPLGSGESKGCLRRQFGLSEDKPAILFVGRFVEKKGLSAMKHMVDLRPAWTWVFAGWGPIDPRRWNADNVQVFSSLRGPSMAALYRACDILVLPSTGEGFPLVIQEALASGLGVVCGAETLEADPAMKAFVRGASVRKGADDQTAREFLSAIDDLLDPGAESIEKSEARRAFALSRYSWKGAANRYVEIVSRLVSQGGLALLQSEQGTAETRR
jgi:glycosyltransferase involved in cell wall biosynthesis